MTDPSETQGEQVEPSSVACFSQYLREHDVTLREGVTPAQFATEADSLAHELALATDAAKGIFKNVEIARQFKRIAEHASSVSGILEKSSFIREEIQHLTIHHLLEAWGRKVHGESVDALTDEQHRALDHEHQSIQRIFEAYPIASLVSAIVEAGHAGKRGTERSDPDAPEQRRDTIRNETIANRCADLIENLTAHRAARAYRDAGDRQELVGPYSAFVDVVCGRIHEILQNQRFETERPHPSDRTLKQVIRDRRL